MKENINIVIKIAFLACFIYSLILFKQFLNQNEYYYYDHGSWTKVNKVTGIIYIYNGESWITIKEAEKPGNNY